jgi:hypothetical protein
MTSTMLPPDPPYPLLHTRRYEVRAFKKDDGTVILRGVVRDDKPAGMYIEGDPEPLTIHHMIVDLTVAFPSLEIVGADVVFETHPHLTCPSITAHYDKLVGLSIARGFTHKVRELFGGPRGCTHTTALLQAMAPVAVQCFWSMQVTAARERGGAPMAQASPEERRQMLAHNLNTCHVWVEDGEQIQRVERGESPEPPLWVKRRMEALGRDPSEWMSPMSASGT